MFFSLLFKKLFLLVKSQFTSTGSSQLSRMIILLTTLPHKSSVWNTKVLEILTEVGEEARILLLEDLVNCVTNPFKPGTVVVNRVSDACDNAMYQAALLIFASCNLWNVPVWNDCYATVSRKWFHHLLFGKAGLLFPKTERVLMGKPSSKILPPFLFKPNAGGFGAGIEKFENTVESLDEAKDGVLQELKTAKAFYRVWFLQGKIQCAVRRIPDSQEECGCAASATTLEAVTLPSVVVEEIEECLLPLLPKANCGSVEFLTEESSDKRYFFDINLVSTLPLRTLGADVVWGEGYNPWKELAIAISKWKRDLFN